MPLSWKIAVYSVLLILIAVLSWSGKLHHEMSALSERCGLLLDPPRIVGGGPAEFCWEVDFDSLFVRCHTLDMSESWSKHVIANPRDCIITSAWTEKRQPLFVINPHCMKEPKLGPYPNVIITQTEGPCSNPEVKMDVTTSVTDGKTAVVNFDCQRSPAVSIGEAEKLNRAWAKEHGIP